MNNRDLDSLIDFVIKDAFEGLPNTDSYSVEKSMRAWFKSYKCECKNCETKNLSHKHEM